VAQSITGELNKSHARTEVVSSWRALDATGRREGSLAVFIMLIFFARNLIYYAKIHLCNFA
jgi:hypothetical protein